MHRLLILALLVVTLSVGIAAAQDVEPVKIGFIATLSGPLNAPGTDILDGFTLALESQENMAGGRPIELIVRDDLLNADEAVAIAMQLIEEEEVDFVAGVVYSSILLAIAPSVFESETFLISGSAGPSQLAGEGCSPYFFNVAYQNDSMNEAMGQYLSDEGYENVFVLAPDYAAGRDAVTGFKRFFTGTLAAELYTPLNQPDFSLEFEQIREAAPDAVYTFQAGASAVAFISQYAASGLMDSIPLFLPGVSADADTIRAAGDATEGLFNSSHWAIDLDNPANEAFVADFEASFERLPSMFAAQGYDSANLIMSAVNTLDGDLSDKAAVEAALEAAAFEPVRGAFTFNSNHFPLQDVYLRQVVRNADGELVNQIVDQIFESHPDAYSQACAMGAE